MSQLKVAPTREQIEKRAYELYLARDCEPGMDVEDWLAAEKELTFARELKEAEAKQGRPPRKTKVMAVTQPRGVSPA